jgi:hypothetical protein
MKVAHLSDEELVAQLDECIGENRRSVARIIVFLIEVEERRIHLKSACSSMYDYCIRRRGMSEGQAYRRIAAARLVRKFPFLLERIVRGEVSLSVLALLKPHVTRENVHELLGATAGKRKIDVEMFLAKRFGLTRPRIHYGLPFMPDEELWQMMERARELLSHAVPDGDLLKLTKRAYAALIEKAEKERRARTSNARPPKVPAEKGISRETLRAVYDRDGEQCAYVDPATGERCPARAFLQTDHIRARAKGGGDDLPNLRIACAAHNRWFAERVFGREYIDERIRLRQERSQTHEHGKVEPPE